MRKNRSSRQVKSLGLKNILLPSSFYIGPFSLWTLFCHYNLISSLLGFLNFTLVISCHSVYYLIFLSNFPAMTDFVICWQSVNLLSLLLGLTIAFNCLGCKTEGKRGNSLTKRFSLKVSGAAILSYQFSFSEDILTVWRI